MGNRPRFSICPCGCCVILQRALGHLGLSQAGTHRHIPHLPQPTGSPDNGPASATLPSACARPPTQQARINPGPWAQATVLRGDNEPSQWALNPAFPQQCRSPVSSTVTPTAEDINGANAHGWAILAHERALVLVVNGAFSGPCQRRDGRQRGEGAGQV